jgi:4'-phosphopantetheinyl transferase
MNIKDFAKGKNFIWLVEIEDQNYKKAQTSLNILSTQEINRWYSFKFEKNKASYLISRIALRNILSLATNVTPEKINFSFTNYGKPFIADFPNLHFNLSHSNKKTLIAVSRQQIGIDIEYFDTRIDYFGIVKHFFSAEECDFIKNQKNCLAKRKIFFKLWTQKEALLKALGLGLFGNTKAINFGVFDQLDKSFVGFDPKDWSLRWLEINDDSYISAVAYEGYRAAEFEQNVWLF